MRRNSNKQNAKMKSSGGIWIGFGFQLLLLFPQAHSGAKGIVEREGNTNSRVEGRDRGRLGQTMCVRMNGGKERMHGVDKMD